MFLNARHTLERRKAISQKSDHHLRVRVLNPYTTDTDRLLRDHHSTNWHGYANARKTLGLGQTGQGLGLRGRQGCYSCRRVAAGRSFEPDL